MAHKFTFKVYVEVERDTGKFASREEIAEALMSELESADPSGIYGIGPDGSSDYSVTDFTIEED